MHAISPHRYSKLGPGVNGEYHHWLPITAFQYLGEGNHGWDGRH